MHSNTISDIRPAATTDDAVRAHRVGHQHQALVDELRRTAQSRMAQHDMAQRRSRVLAWMRRTMW